MKLKKIISFACVIMLIVGFGYGGYGFYVNNKDYSEKVEEVKVALASSMSPSQKEKKMAEVEEQAAIIRKDCNIQVVKGMAYTVVSVMVLYGLSLWLNGRIKSRQNVGGYYK